MAQTVPPHKWTKLIYNPPESLQGTHVPDLHNMKFDKKHYSRAFNQCIGRRVSASECWQTIPQDDLITPPNPTPDLFPKELADALECMADRGDARQCNHFTEALFKKVNFPDEPAPTKMDKVKAQPRVLALPLFVAWSWGFLPFLGRVFPTVVVG